MTTGSVLFVHGSGNRKADAVAYGATIASNLKVTKGHMHISTWGDSVGPDARFPRLPETMPIVQKAFPETTKDVLADPYGPLREMAGGGGMGAFGDQGKEDARAILGLMRFGGLDLSETQITDDQLSAAATEVAESPEFAAAGGDPVALIDAAVTAAAARAVQRQGPKVVSGAFGFNIKLDPIAKVKEALSKAAMGGVGIIGSTVGELGGPIARWLSEQFAKRRTPLMQQQVLVAADVLFYQRHSAAIRAHVRKEIQDLKAPRLVMGHSLGGIILVDTLFGEDAVPIDVDLLVTFGSQSPLLQALEAFGDVTPGAIPWLNIWTRFDFVSFLAGGLWPGKVTDEEIAVDVGFPEAHGAYYEAREFYDKIRGHPASAAVLT